jgi:signal peptidase II
MQGHLPDSKALAESESTPSGPTPSEPSEHLSSVEGAPARQVSARALILVAAVALVVLGLDQLAKAWVVSNLTPGKLVNVVGELLQFEFVKNSGAAFSLASGSTWIFSIIATVVVVFIVWFARRIRSVGWAILFGMLLGGTIGNLLDRFFREPSFGLGHVVDFIRIPLLPAIFNLADVAICVSMGLFIILTLLGIGLDGTRTRRVHPTQTPPTETTEPVSSPQASDRG